MNPREQLFALEWMKDCNATKAAIRAGYSERSAATIGWRLLQKDEIQQLIRGTLQAQIDAKIADVNEICLFLTDVMRDEAAPLAGRLSAAALLARRWGIYRPAAKQQELPEPPLLIDDIPDELPEP